jgi:hypothetical protein
MAFETTDNSVLRELRDAVKDLNVSTKRANFWLNVSTIAIVILTLVLVFQGFTILSR